MIDSPSFDPEDPLARAPGESLRANAAFRDYALMGPGRSLRKLQERYKGVQRGAKEGTGERLPPSVRLSRLSEWSVDHHWQERVLAYERRLDREEEELWRERRKKLRSTEWDASDKLLGLAAQIVDAAPDFISEHETVDKNGTITIYKALDGHLAVKAAETGSDLGRRAAGMEKEKTKVEHSGLEVVQPADYGKIDDEQLERLIHNLIAAAAERSPGDGPGGKDTPADQPATPEPPGEPDPDGEPLGAA